MDNVLVLTTTELEEKNAQNIANILLEKKLAACVSIKEIISTYIWEDEIVKNKEYEIVIKSIPENLELIINRLKIESSFALPQIIYRICSSELNYANWVYKSLN